MKGGIEAAKAGHEVVMSPTDYVYLDYMQAIQSPSRLSMHLFV